MVEPNLPARLLQRHDTAWAQQTAQSTNDRDRIGQEFENQTPHDGVEFPNPRDG
jgi:hypothetical protein